MTERELTDCLRIKVQSLHRHEFWWSHYGFLPRYDDILHLTCDNPKINYGISLFTRGFTNISDPELKAQRFDKTIAQLQGQETIIFTSKFSPQPMEFREARLPGNEGKKHSLPFPPRFSVYHPAEYETYDMVNQAVQRFAREYCKIPFSEAWMGDIPQEESVRQEYEKHAIKVGKNKGPKELKMDIESLLTFVGQAEISRFPTIKHGIFGTDDQLYAVLKDGSRHVLGKPNLKVIE